MSDAFLQVAADGVGKKVDMDQVATTSGDTIYRQRAVLVGETGELLQTILEESITQTKLLTAMCRILISCNPEFAGVDLLDKDKWDR